MLRRDYRHCRCLLVLLIGILAATCAGANDYIMAFHSTLTLKSDSTMRVKEDITVRYTTDQRYGFVREIPLQYRDQFGQQYAIVGINMLSMTRNNLDEPYRVQRSLDSIQIISGNPKVPIMHGAYTFTLEYDVYQQLPVRDGRRVLHWPVTDRQCNLGIHRSTVIVQLPGTVDAADVRVSAHTATEARPGAMTVIGINAAGRVGAYTSKPLKLGDNFSITLEVPQDIVGPLPVWKVVAYFIALYRMTFTTLLLLGGLVAYFLWAWHRFTHEKGTPIYPHFMPPAGMSPADLRYLWCLHCDEKALAVTIISLAMKGWVHILERDKRIYINHERQALLDNPEALLDHPQALLGLLRDGRAYSITALSRMLEQPDAAINATIDHLLDIGTPLDIRQDMVRLNLRAVASRPDPCPAQPFPDESRVMSDLLGSAISSPVSPESARQLRASLCWMRTALEARFKGRLLETNLRYVGPGALLAALCATLFNLDVIGDLWYSSVATPMFLIYPAALAYVLGHVVLRVRKGLEVDFPRMLSGILQLTGVAIGIFFVIGLTWAPQVPHRFTSLIFIGVVAGIVALAAAIIKSPTAPAQKLLDELASFRAFLMGPYDPATQTNLPDKTVELFERYLPYAMALDVERAWADQFAHVLSHAHDDGAPYQPGWYYGVRWQCLPSGRFSGLLAEDLTRAIVDALAPYNATPPQRPSGTPTSLVR